MCASLEGAQCVPILRDCACVPEADWESHERIGGGLSRVIRSLAAFVDALRRLRYLHRRPVALAVYAGVTSAAYLLAYLIRFEFEWRSAYSATILMSLPLLLVLRLVTQQAFRLSTGRWRFVGIPDLIRLAAATFMGSLAFLLATRVLPFEPRVPLSVIAIEGMLTAGLIGTIWVAYRTLFEVVRSRRSENGAGHRRVLIIGAGEAGYMLAREMVRAGTCRPVGFVDDDPHKWGTRLAGLEVIGATDDLSAICTAFRIEELMLAVPHATPKQLRVLVEKCAATRLPYRVLPSIAEVLAGNVRLDQVREVRIEDLLGRDPVTLTLDELAQELSGGCVLVTGAAGSIGSELSRQIARHAPAILLVLDQAETELFYLDMELRESFPHLRVVPLVRDVADRAAVESVFESHRPSHVFHAAAYKHVPLMEVNPREAVLNNTLASCIVGDAAGRHGAKKFVLISTDKAVQPRSVMGASKRLAEIGTLELQDRHPATVFAAVRFGNVLGSNGSVIPIFRRQLAEGRPLTVTHPDVTRYFMTIPEAVQLVLQASLLPEIRGHIAMLEMGEPVRIVDLAENLLRLSGINPTHIVFSGLRPGEKLHEELVAPEEEAIATSIDRVRLIRREPGGRRMLLGGLAMLEAEVRAGILVRVAMAFESCFPNLPNPFPASPTLAPSQPWRGEGPEEALPHRANVPSAEAF